MFARLGLMICLIVVPCVVCAGNVILMIGGGMGENHVRCAAESRAVLGENLPVQGHVTTRSADSDITDSAAAATAYACGIKTKNGYLGVDANQKPCRTLAEKALEKGFFVGIASTDMETGATPSAFYAHVPNRHEADTIRQYLTQARQHMRIQVAGKSLLSETNALLAAAAESGKPFFIMLEGALIDTKSHENKLEAMKDALFDFDAAVRAALAFAAVRSDTTVVVTADHETGGLTPACVFTTRKHTGAAVPLWAAGARAELFKGTHDNTQINHLIHGILFDNTRERPN